MYSERHADGIGMTWHDKQLTRTPDLLVKSSITLKYNVCKPPWILMLIYILGMS